MSNPIIGSDPITISMSSATLLYVFGRIIYDTKKWLSNRNGNNPIWKRIDEHGKSIQDMDKKLSILVHDSDGVKTDLKEMKDKVGIIHDNCIRNHSKKEE